MSLHDILEPLDHNAIRPGRQVRLRPGEIAVVFSPSAFGMVTQSIVAHPEGERPLQAREVALLLDYACTQPDMRERLNARLDEIRKQSSASEK